MGLTQTPNNVSTNKRWLRNFFQIIIESLKLLFLAMIGGILIGASILLLPDLSSKPSPTNSGSPLFPSPLIILLVIYLTVAIHQLGHLVSGVLVGFRFVVLGLGPLQIRREERGLRLGFKLTTTALDGFVITLPTDDHDLKRRLAILFAGGPLASLLQAILVYLVLFIWQDPLWIASVPVLVLLWIWSVGSFVYSSWPIKISGIMSDGARLLTLLKGGPQAERLEVYYALAGDSLTGRRPRDLNPFWLRRALAISDGSADEACLNLLAYFHTLDKGEPDQAAAYLDRALSLWQTLPPFSRAQYFLEAAYYEAIYAQNAIAARTWLGQAKQHGLLLEKHTQLRVEAAVLLAEGRSDAALTCASQGLNLLDRTVDKGGKKAAADWLHEIMAVSHAG